MRFGLLRFDCAFGVIGVGVSSRHFGRDQCCVRSLELRSMLAFSSWHLGCRICFARLSAVRACLLASVSIEVSIDEFVCVSYIHVEFLLLCLSA